MESIFAAIPKIFEQIEANPEAREAFVFAAWKRIVGELLNEHTVPVALTQSKLRVAVANRTWQRHLEDMAAQILAKLNASLGRSPVKYIEFFIDEKKVAAMRSDRRVSNEGEAEQQISDEVREAAEAINDAKLRKAFMLAATSCLERDERMNKAT